MEIYACREHDDCWVLFANQPGPGHPGVQYCPICSMPCCPMDSEQQLRFREFIKAYVAVEQK